jgi:CRP-like cAMP-binding protein
MKMILDYIESICPVSDGLKEHLIKVIQFRRLNKREWLLTPGETARHLYFIGRGLVRCYYMKDGDEVSSWFMAEGDFMTDVLSFFSQQPSLVYIQALEDCELYGIAYEDIQFLYKTFLEFNFIGRVVTEKYYMQSEERLYSIRRRTARERYNYLVERWPWLLQRVPQKYLASYLDIGLRTMSRSRDV